MKKCFLLITIILSIYSQLSAQQNTGVIRGRVFNSKSNEGVPFATIQIWGTTTGTVTNFHSQDLNQVLLNLEYPLWGLNLSFQAH